MSDDFADRLASTAPAPGGGAAANRAGLHATCLLRMVTSITMAREKESRNDADTFTDKLRDIELHALTLSEGFSRLEREDIRAFESYIEALRLPRASEEQKSSRRSAILVAAHRATQSPLSTLETALETLDLADRLLVLASEHRMRAESDIGAAVELAHAAFRAAELNVRVNFPLLADESKAYRESFHKLLEELESKYPRLRASVLELFEQ